jgi:hypothetical protein
MRLEIVGEDEHSNKEWSIVSANLCWSGINEKSSADINE